MNKDYGRHILRTWVDTHQKSIRADPEIYLPGEIDTRDADSESDDDDDTTEDDGEDDVEAAGGDDDEYVDEDELANIHIGMKRKAAIATRSGVPTKVAKTMAWARPTAARRVIDDHHRADLTLIDAPVDEDVLVHPYGRHSCLYIEIKVDANEKPNPLEAVSGLLLGVLYY